MKPLNKTTSMSRHIIGLHAFPIGSPYTQYPGTPTPQELFGGVWEKRFNDEAIFFRTEGVNANPFNGAIQDEMVGPHTHPGPFNTSKGQGRWDRGTEWRSSNNLNRIDKITETDGHETRPKNRTYCIWVRVG